MKNKRALRRHLNSKCQSVSNSDVNQQSLTSNNNVLRVKKEVKSGKLKGKNLKKVVCEICTKSFETKSGLRKHMKHHKAVNSNIIEEEIFSFYPNEDGVDIPSHLMDQISSSDIVIKL